MIYEFAFKNFSSYKSMADLLCLLRNWKIQLKYQQLRIHISYIVQSEDSFFQSEIYKNMSGGHPTAVAYSGMANAYERLLNEWQGFENTQLLDFKIAGLVKNFFTM